MQQNLRQYSSIQASTCDRGSLLLLVYEKTLTEIHRARHYLTLDPASGEANACLMKAQLGVMELDKTLNFKVLPELAQSLHSLYLHVLLHLGDGMTTRQAEPLVKAEAVLAALRDTWKEAIRAQPASAKAV